MKKALKAKFNVIAEESNDGDPEQSFASFYIAVARECRKFKEFGVAGLAYSNAAREFQISGAFNEAWRLSQKALVFLKSDQGGYQYHLALLQKADILLDLGRKTEALIAIEESQLAPFPEVIEARKLVLKKAGLPCSTEIDQSFLINTWQERMSSTTRSSLGPLEQTLIRTLANGPQTREQLISAVYSDQSKVNHDSLSNRFNVLLNRIRRRNEHTIVFNQNKYELLPPPHQSQYSRNLWQQRSGS